MPRVKPPRRPKVKGMTHQQKAFADEYLVDLNGTQAARRAGYKKKTAGSQANRLLKNQHIDAYIKAALEKRTNKLELTAERVLLELARIAFFDPRRLFNEDGTPKQIQDLDDDCAAAVAGIEVTEEIDRSTKVLTGRTKKYRVADKNAAMTNALRHLGLLHDKLDLTSKGKSIAPDFSRLTPKEQLKAHELLRKAKAQAAE